MSLLFDTNILIDHLNGIRNARQEIEASSDPAISVISWIEVMIEAANPAQDVILRSFLTNFQCLPVTHAVAERAAETL